MSSWLLNEQGALRSGWKALGFFALFYLLGNLAATLALELQVRQELGLWVEVLLGVLATALCLKWEGNRFHSVGLRFNGRWWLEALAGTLGGILLILVMALAVRALNGFHWERTSGSGLSPLLASFWSLLGVAFGEEILARGYAFQRVVAGAGPWAGQLGFAALFAYWHWGNPGMEGPTLVWATLNIGLAAILLGFCYLRTRSLALPIGLHLGWNWAQGSLLGFGVSGTTDFKGLWTPVYHGRPEWLTGGAFGLEASLPCTLVCGLGILLLWRWKGTVPTDGASTASAS